MKFTYYIGCDVSKNELDFAVYQGSAFVLHREVGNDPKSINAFFKELGELNGFELQTSVVCMEHTGIYNNPLLVYLHERKGNVCLESALQIRNSQGSIRGKNDKIDSIRIAEYAYTFREKIKLWQPKREVIQRLSLLTSDRDRLIAAKKMLAVSLKERAKYLDPKLKRDSERVFSKTLKAMEVDLEKIEDDIRNVIKSDKELDRLFNIITSIGGIGQVTAVGIILTTNEFKDIDDPKKYACHAGVAPFMRESGVHRGKAKVSPMANKSMKTLLHMAALAAIRFNGDMRAYFTRKVGEGKKNKMSVINAVRNKLIHRIFACVKQNRKYEKTYMSSLA